MLLRGLFRPWVLAGFLTAAEIETVMSRQQSFVDAFVNKTHEIAGVSELILDKLVDNLTLTGSLDDLPAVS